MTSHNMAEETEPAHGMLTYGWASFRPRCLQFLNTPKWLAFFLCQYFLTQNAIVNGIFPASVSTIERRFGFTRLVNYTILQIELV